MSVQVHAKATRPDYASLKARQREIRNAFPDAFGLRIHRSISWLGRAERERDDLDVKFVLLWIGFNAAYAGHVDDDLESERSEFKLFFETLVSLDAESQIYTLVWERFSQEIRVLLENQFVFAAFWQHANGIAGASDWQERLNRSKASIQTALVKRDTARILSVLFDRLYVLRNQLVHGGATWNSSVNRDQVRDGCALLGCLLPVFINLMMDSPDRDWGRPYYPIIA